MRRWIYALLLLSSVGCGRKGPAEPIWVGHLAPFSGPRRVLGDHAKQGIQLAVEAVNLEEPFVTSRHIGVIHVDTRGEVDTVQPEAVRLLKVNRAAALLGCTEAPEVERLARALASYPSPPLITPSVLPAQAQTGVIFAMRPSPGQYVRTLLRFATQDLKATKIGLVSDSRLGLGARVAEVFSREFAKDAATRLEEWTYRSNSELLGLAEKATAAKRDALVFAGSQADFVRFRLQLPAKESPPLFFLSEEEDAAVLLADRAGSDGVYLASAYVADAAGAANAEFVKKYTERFQEAPDAAAAIGYESLQLVAQGIKGLKPGEPLRGEIEKVGEFGSLTGPFSFGKKDHYPRRALFVVQIQEGKAKTVKRYDPEKE